MSYTQQMPVAYTMKTMPQTFSVNGFQSKFKMF